MSFKIYLEQKKYRKSTINGHLANIERFNKWAATEHINYQTAGYNHLLKYIESVLSRGTSKTTINNYLSSQKKYYEYLVKTGIRKDNPASELRLKNNGKKVLQNLLTTEQLETLYHSYKNKPVWEFDKKNSQKIHSRNLVLLGLMVYQGLDTEELKKLETSHVNLNQSSIYIPSRARSNSRILKLNAAQILPMQAYLQNHKGMLITSKYAGSVLDWLLKQLRKINRGIESTRQIRNSVIVNWLKIHNIRQVQYMAGHRHIHSTEKYKEEDLRDLQAQLNLFHPLK